MTLIRRVSRPPSEGSSLVSPQVVLPPSQSVSTSGTAPGEPVSPWENMVRVSLLRMLADEARGAVNLV